jgi:hypothetical protein
MNNDREQARRYRVLLRGELGEPFGSLFEGIQIQQRAGITILTGTVVNQAHLHALIQRTRQLDLELVSVEPADEPQPWTTRRQAVASGGVYLTCMACGHLHEAEALRQSLYVGQQPVGEVQARSRGGLGRRLARRAVNRQLTRELLETSPRALPSQAALDCQLRSDRRTV